MHKFVRHVRAALPYKVPNIKSEYLGVDVDLGKLTILLGPNASGKTAVLEAIGYTISSHLSTSQSILGISLTTTLRPREVIPSIFVGEVTLESNVRTIYIEVTEAVYTALLNGGGYVGKMMRYVMGEEIRKLLRELEDDARKGLSLILQLPHLRLKFSIVHTLLHSLVNKVVGYDAEIYFTYLPSSPLFLRHAITSGAEAMREISRMTALYPSRHTHIKVLYSLDEGKTSKSLVIETPRGIGLIKRGESESKETPEIAVFHPGFIYWRGVFEGLYRLHLQEGVVNEDKAIELLREYITWVKGFELVGNILHLKSVNGRSIPVYELSDGHRVATFMSLLYAISKPPKLFLIDTPEAFVHPDGLPIVADLITHLTSEGNQVVITTQSMEFLRMLLNKAKEREVLENTLVERIEITEEGVVRAKGKWSGEVSLRSIEGLGIDLRR